MEPRDLTLYPYDRSRQDHHVDALRTNDKPGSVYRRAPNTARWKARISLHEIVILQVLKN